MNKFIKERKRRQRIEPYTAAPLKAGHTPGPWSVGSRNGGFNANTIYAGEDSVASVYGIPLHRTLSEVAGCEGLPNARLIAAAPELKQEVGRMISVLENIISRLQPVHALMARELESDIQRLRAAIAKAGG